MTTERADMERYLLTIRSGLRAFTEITWTPAGVRINERTYTTLREMRTVFGKKRRKQ